MVSIERIDPTTVIVRTGDYGACVITTVTAYIEDRWGWAADEIPASERYVLGVQYVSERHGAGGAILNTQTDYDPYPSFHDERPTAVELVNLSREMADDFETAARTAAALTASDD